MIEHDKKLQKVPEKTSDLEGNKKREELFKQINFHQGTLSKKESESFKPLPCHESCEKCGSSNIKRAHITQGGIGSIYDHPKDRLVTKGRNSYPLYKIAGEYIRHNCICCGFMWGTDCLDKKSE